MATRKNWGQVGADAGFFTLDGSPANPWKPRLYPPDPSCPDGVEALVVGEQDQEVRAARLRVRDCGKRGGGEGTSSQDGGWGGADAGHIFSLPTYREGVGERNPDFRKWLQAR
ncbi:MAG: hypothetical protein ACKV22_36550, partial [Bryobacteraceae bacterium]